MAATSMHTITSGYLDSCRRHEVPPNSAVLSWLEKAKVQRLIQQKSCISLLLGHLKDVDLSPLIDALNVYSFEVDVIDILYKAPCVLNQDNVLSLLRAVNSKLRMVDLQGFSFREDILRNLFQGGLQCELLRLKSTEIRNLNMTGRFLQLQTLNLDFCTSLTRLEKDCFSCMPKLMCLSMCGTRLANLWTTTAVLSKLPSLVELRFQNCMCCTDTGPCPASSNESKKLLLCNRNGSSHLTKYSGCNWPTNSSKNSMYPASVINDAFGDYSGVHDVCRRNIRFSEDTLDIVSKNFQGLTTLQLVSDVGLGVDRQTSLQIEVSFGKLDIQEKDESPTSVLDWDSSCTSAFSKVISHHPSPICFEKHYRECMIFSCPKLQVLDNSPVLESDKEAARTIFTKCYEYLPYQRQHKESVVNVLHMREMGTSNLNKRRSSATNQPSSHGKNQCFYTRSLCAAKLGCSAWPSLNPLCEINSITKEEGDSLRPRQFEYHPSDSSLIALGTLDGEVVVRNHEKGNIINYIPSVGTANSILGLCWLNKHSSKLLAGSDNGSLRLYDMNHMLPTVEDSYSGAAAFDDFEHLTSVHVNSMDDMFIASSYSKKLAVYDIHSGRRIQLFTEMHREAINVAKFAHCSPFLFVTSSFDHDIKMWDLRQKPVHPCYTASSSRGNVMVCFSPDDLYLLVSAVDNEVKQLSAADGRLQTYFEIASKGSVHNYTRSYYMNGRDYIISGSCDESVIRICCAQTGRRLRDIYLERKGQQSSVFVQSLRSDPFRHFHMAVLAAYVRPSSKWEIIKVNLLDYNEYTEDFSENQYGLPSHILGGCHKCQVPDGKHRHVVG